MRIGTLRATLYRVGAAAKEGGAIPHTRALDATTSPQTRKNPPRGEGFPIALAAMAPAVSPASESVSDRTPAPLWMESPRHFQQSASALWVSPPAVRTSYHALGQSQELSLLTFVRTC